MRGFVAVCALALLAAGCFESKSTHVAISADLPPRPSTWPRYPDFSEHSCWGRRLEGGKRGYDQFAPAALPPRGIQSAPPSQLVRRVLERFGDRTLVRTIRVGPLPPARELAGYFRGRRPPKNAVWAYISAPTGTSEGLAEWETALVAGALRDDFCTAGGPPLVGWSVSGEVLGVADESHALNQHFPNPSPRAFRARVAAIGKRYGFRPVSVRLLRPRELAPIVIVETRRDRKAFISDVQEMMSLLDPQALAKGHRATTFEGLFFEARDAKGRFVRVYHVLRGEVMGGQWSAVADSYPYPHG